jgi:hypothetical protein
VSVGADFPNVAGKKFGAVVESLGEEPAQIVVERAMYASAGGIVWAAGTNALATNLDPTQTNGCAGEGTVRSGSGTTPSTIVFQNNRTSSVSLFWLNYQGQRVLFHTIPPGESRSTATYLTHPWLVAAASGECLGIHLPPGAVVIH